MRSVLSTSLAQSQGQRTEAVFTGFLGLLPPSLSPHQPFPPVPSPSSVFGARATRKVSRGSRFLASGSLRNLA